ncbi:MAG: anti-sigma factor family protein [Desulfobaccales bacterium]
MNWQCALLQRWLPEYPDGDLPAFWLRWLKPHVERCDHCREELAALKETAQAIRTSPVADPGPEFWTDFSRELHLKLVQAVQEGRMVPARSSWWGRIPYLVGASALAVLLLWVAFSHLDSRQPGPAAPQIAQQKAATGPVAVAPQAPAGQEPNNYLYVSSNRGEETPPEEDLGDDLDSTLSGMTPQQKEMFLKKLNQQQKDGSCIKSYSSIFCA